MRKHLTLALLTSALFVTSCNDPGEHPPHENYTLFTEVDRIQLVGGTTAAEISAYDPKTKKLFVINAVKAAIDVIDMSNPFDLTYERDIQISAYGAGVNSVSVKNGMLAAAVESNPKTNPGKVVVWNTSDLSVKAIVPVGSLPDMVTFSKDGKYLVTANEGEPNEDYSVDPNGSISIINVNQGFSVTTLDFTSFNSQAAFLRSKGYRTPGPAGTSLAADTEPEYVAISHDNRKAWITLQENNAIAKVDLHTKVIENIFPLGYKDHSKPGNDLDPSDRDNGIFFGNWPVKGMYMPDAISSFEVGGVPFLITANEGDSRLRPTSDDALPPYSEGGLFNEESRVGGVVLDPVKFPNAATLQANDKLGRLKITNRMGDTDGDGDFDELYSFGARSFSIVNGNSGQLVYESGSKLEKYVIEKLPSLYDDSRSDDKGVEPESVTTGKIGSRTLAFVGIERADALVIVDVTNPNAPIFLQALQTGDAPEGVLFIPAEDSPNKKAIVVTSCEGDGTVNVFQLSGQDQY
ncbi:choice-of-anchor I family protein [Chryseosolibacter indicus]|uniref:Choice-of-anchor I family protein n=1 Tax=Chryseosolibacter indicus TaxID=2782351 RepID=A0ABS5VT52_9BACT|nr:choice-of-anchor I family protein [Chryseosolibacter indicus]MBT1704054.1 choice-of-anchor I family protein [Chryseosolibacter indicus]